MSLKLVVLTVILGLALAEPIAKRGDITEESELSDVIDEETASTELSLSRLVPDKALLLFELLNSVIGYKVTGLTLAVAAIEWIISNKMVIIFGAMAALGFCKYTGKCSLAYEEFIPVAQLRSYVTPERLETAEKFLYTAVEKYAEKNGKSLSAKRE